MTFKEQMRADIKNTFMNIDEFSETHIVNGKEMSVTIDNNELIKRKKRVGSHMDGIYANQKLIYVEASEFGALPAEGSVLTLDNRTYRVEEAVSEDGIYSITIGANKGR